MKRLMITAVRHPGNRAYECQIFGEGKTDLPPMRLQMTLREMQQWLRTNHPVTPPSPPSKPELSVVSN